MPSGIDRERAPLAKRAGRGIEGKREHGAIVTMREIERVLVAVPGHAVVQLGRIRLEPQSAGQRETVQGGRFGTVPRAALWVEHRSDPEPPAAVARAFVEAVQRGVERRWRQQLERFRPDVQPIQPMTQSDQRLRPALDESEGADLGGQMPGALEAARQAKAVQRALLHVDPIECLLPGHPGRGLGDLGMGVEQKFDVHAAFRSA